MKRASQIKRLMAFLMAFAICFGLLPRGAFAAETDTYAQVTSPEDFTSGRYVLVTDAGYAPGIYDNGKNPWITALRPTVSDGVVTDAAGAVWDLTVEGSSVKLTDANGTSVAPKGGNNNGIRSAGYDWTWSFENGRVTFSGTGADTVVLAGNAASENKFRAYKTSTVSANPKGYPSAFTVYKLVEQTAEPDPSQPTGPVESDPSQPPVSTEPSEPMGSTATLVTDAAALQPGDQIIIAASGSDFALSTNQKTNNRGQAEINKSGDGAAVTYGEDTQVITLEAGLTEGTFAFHVGSGYLYAASSSGNYLKTESTLSANSSWTVEIEDGIATVKSVGGNARNWLRHNATSGLFACYGSGQKDISIYKLGAAEEEAPEIPAVSAIPDGDYVIWAPACSKALSSVYGGFYNNGIDVTMNGDVLVGYTNAEIWTVRNNGDGTITISSGGKNLAMADTFNAMTLGEKHAAWMPEDAGNGLWYVKNVTRDAWIQWYAEQGYWSACDSIGPGEEGKFALRFTPAKKGFTTDDSVVADIAQWGGMTAAENISFVYGDKYVSGDEADTEDIFTAVVNGKTVTPYTVGGNHDAPLYYMGGAGIGSGTNDYLQLAVNARGFGAMALSFRLRASNSGPGSFRLVYSTDNGTTWQTFSTGLYSYGWTRWGQNEAGESVILDSGVAAGDIPDGKALTSLNPGNYVEFFFDVPAGADNCENLLIRLVPGTEKANGKDGAVSATGTVRMDSVVLSGSPIVEDAITGFVTVNPDGREVLAVGTELTMTSDTEGAAISYRVNGGTWKTYDEALKPTMDTLPCNIEVYASAEGKTDSVVLLYRYAAGTVEPVRFSPNGGGICIEGESAEITLSTATMGAAIYYATSADGISFGDYAEYTGPILVEKGFGKLVVRAYAVKAGYRDSQVVTHTFTERISDTYQIFFGQLHAHTNISDGTGSVEEAFQYASQVENLDFLAVTDHSNSFDGADNGSISKDGGTISAEWKQGHAAAAAVTDEDFVGLYGYEMTWSNGLGHINTFNTPGWQSRTQADYKNQSTALQNYYAALATVPESISQFNHPGTTFGDFSDFAHYSERTDALITLIEVGNGEGAIGSGGYFTSYEYYTRALDKGWHVAPTNNQDNHKGLWGDANTGRSVVLADSLTPEGIYDAMRNYRVYATEDNDLNIYYTLDGFVMGSILEETDAGENLTISVNLADATDSAIGKIEVIVNGGMTAASQTLNAPDGTVTLTVPARYNYYYIRITQPDGDIAVTAPVWVGKVEAVGISSLKAESALIVAGEEQTFTAELFNNEDVDLMVESLVYTDQATGQVLYTETGIATVPRESTAFSSFGHTFAADGVYTITATLKGTLNGMEKTYTKDLEVTVMPKTITSDIIVDGTHFNDYVTGYYGGNMNNMAAIAAAQGIQVRVEKNAITPEMLENCSLLVISAPAKKSGTANAGDYNAKPFEDGFISMVAEYVEKGGSLLVCGMADYQDKGAAFGPEGHTAAQLNKLLAAVGSTMRMHDDEAYDDDSNGGQAYRLYPENFNMESPWCAGILVGQKYSQYSGCTVDPGAGTWLVRGFDTTYSIDSDGDGSGGVEKGQAVFLAVEETGFGGNIFAAGGVFISDFEVKAEMDNSWDLPYANRAIYENIVGITRSQPAVTPIAEVRASAAEALGRVFVIEGYVTAGTDNSHTTFFDAIYVQDGTGGITVFPYAEEGLELGTKVRITGYTDAYQGDIEIQIMSLEILDAPRNVIEPEKVSNADGINYAEKGGELLQVEGRVTEVILTADGRGVAQFVVTDEKGDSAKVFIDGYIRSGTTGENTLADIVRVGNDVSAVGLLYMHPEGDSEKSVPVLRVRNCDEVVLIRAKPETDKAALKSAIDNARSKKQSDYNGKSWNAMQAALRVAESVYADESAAQADIDDAAEALNKAIRALAPAAGRNPETSDSTAVEAYLLTMTLSMLGALALIINRKRFMR